MCGRLSRARRYVRRSVSPLPSRFLERQDASHAAQPSREQAKKRRMIGKAVPACMQDMAVSIFRVEIVVPDLAAAERSPWMQRPKSTR